MEGLQDAIGQTRQEPEVIVESTADPEARLYYRRYPQTPVGDKLLCVVVKVAEDDAFVVTAYLTDQVKRGIRIWLPER
jgi:hypothetical protein